MFGLTSNQIHQLSAFISAATFPPKTIPKISFPKITFSVKTQSDKIFSSLQLLQTFPIKIQYAGPNYCYQTVTISTFLMFPQSFPGNFPNSSLHPKIMSAFLSCCLQLLSSILKIHAIGRGPPATISNLISSTYYRKNRKSDPENQNYPTWFPIRIHFTHDQKKTRNPLKNVHHNSVRYWQAVAQWRSQRYHSYIT